MTRSDEALYERVVGIIEHRLVDPRFSVDDLASAVSMSRSRLHRRLVRISGRPPGRTSRHARLVRAAEMLANSDRGIAEIAAEVGYRDPAHFTRSFKRRFGTTPTKYRAER